MITKSEFMMFLKHPAWLWLKKHDKSKLPEPDENLQRIFDMGHRFEAYAQQLFPDGKKLGFDSYSEYKSLTQRTQEALDGTIFQGRFEADGLTCIVDILDKVEGGYDLYEVKSSTRVKTNHEHDLCFQKILLERSGLDIKRTLVVHVNRDYVRDGEIDPEAITEIEDITGKVEGRREQTLVRIKDAKEIAKLEERPDISPRLASSKYYKDWIDIYKSLVDVDEYSVYNLAYPGIRRLEKFYELGIEMMENIPDSIDLTDTQKAQVRAVKNGRIVYKARLRNFLSRLKEPIHFLDYETLMDVIPPFDGTRPYQQVPFQYSLHVGNEHKEYLHQDDTHPVKELLHNLKKDMEDEGSVVVWYEGFESKRNEEMAEMFPVYEKFLLDVNDRMVDLMIPFKKGTVVDRDFGGSASLKAVLPVLVPDLGYKGMSVSDGSSAQRIWMETFLEGRGDKEKIAQDLLDYCELDTLAMVEILRVLREMST